MQIDRKAVHDRQPDHALERLVFFSDAVFAIAITLLVIDLHPPHIPRGASMAVAGDLIAEIIPSLFGFIVSFWVIGAFWTGHHRAFSLAAHHSDRLIGMNLALLFAVVFMPFATAFMSANLGQVVPAALYDGTMIVLGLLNVRLVRAATSPPVVSPDADPLVVAHIRARGWAVVLGASCAFVFAFISAPFSQAALISIPFWRRLLARRVDRRAAAVATQD